MTSVIVADFIVNQDGDRVGIQSNSLVSFPPVDPSDIVSKQYVDVSFLAVHSTGSSYVGTLDFSANPASALYGNTDVAAIPFTVNRVGNMVNIWIQGFDVEETISGTAIGSGLPKEFWPLPVGTTINDSVVTTPVYSATIPGHLCMLGVGSDGLVRVTGDNFGFQTTSFSYLTTNVA
ncbi:MAG: hypothetical protein P4L69_08100 [Desulfosporosinus sp.]|nr:hypothetical protein [Desulfosporosinus sp.]